MLRTAIRSESRRLGHVGMFCITAPAAARDSWRQPPKVRRQHPAKHRPTPEVWARTRSCPRSGFMASVVEPTTMAPLAFVDMDAPRRQAHNEIYAATPKRIPPKSFRPPWRKTAGSGKKKSTTAEPLRLRGQVHRKNINANSSPAMVCKR